MPSTSSKPFPATATTSVPAILTPDRLIQAISRQGWRGFLSWQSKSGNLEPVFDALVHDPVEDRDIIVCVKLYQHENEQNRGMVNEITGWLITHALGLPQPGRAFLVNVPMAELEKPTQAWVAELKKQAVHYWAFATIKLPAESAALQFNHADLPLLVDDIRRWNNLPSAIALDEHIANTDRHLNNLLRLSKANYALIDNGRLAVERGVAHWRLTELDTNYSFTNILSSQCWNDRPEKGMASNTLKAASAHKDALGKVRAELEDWWRRLLTNPVERIAFDNFITARAADLSILLSRRYHLLPL